MMANTTMVGLRRSHFLAMVLSNTYEMIPNRIPSLMLPPMTIMNTVMKQGMLSAKSSNFNSFTLENIIKPTMINVGLVAAEGMARNNGAKNREMMKNMAIEAAVSPVRPPAPTPEADAT